MTWKYKAAGPAGETVAVPALNLVGEWRGKHSRVAQPLDGLPGPNPGKRAAPRPASQVPALCSPRGAGQAPGVSRALPRAQPCCLAGLGGHAGTQRGTRGSRIGEGGQAAFLHRYPLSLLSRGGWSSREPCL